VRRAAAAAKINLALVVGPLRDDGQHELVTVYQRVALSDRIAVEHSAELHVTGFAGDTLVRRALELVADGDGTSFAARIEKRIPVAAGLGGGSSDAATALRLANGLRAEPHSGEQIEAFARDLGADVPYFLADGPQLGTGDGTELSPLELPQDYWVVLVVPRNAEKSSTGAVYSSFERSRIFTAHREASGSRCLPCRRHGRGSGRLRALPARRPCPRGAAENVRRGARLADRTSVVPLIAWRTASP
jgi:4-diphosphocytidyl-2-C-methyl-D-erythritol kinase